jgi:hypothetical protein
VNTTNSATAESIGRHIIERAYSEFMEMPGLRLTCAQAQRLWGLDETTCRRLLGYLVDAKFLHQPHTDVYSRLTTGYVACPRPRMARASLETARPGALKKTG